MKFFTLWFAFLAVVPGQADEAELACREAVGRYIASYRIAAKPNLMKMLKIRNAVGRAWLNWKVATVKLSLEKFGNDLFLKPTNETKYFFDYFDDLFVSEGLPPLASLSLDRSRKISVYSFTFKTTANGAFPSGVTFDVDNGKGAVGELSQPKLVSMTWRTTIPDMRIRFHVQETFDETSQDYFKHANPKTGFIETVTLIAPEVVFSEKETYAIDKGLSNKGLFIFLTKLMRNFGCFPEVWKAYNEGQLTGDRRPLLELMHEWTDKEIDPRLE